VADYFDMTPEEKTAVMELVEQGKALLDQELKPDGYNVGINSGSAAGQTVMHAHVHLIPRYRGDTDDPRGGVRGVIPEKQKY
jgi:diadenosine tetraphosphate (Ap4A) HIT family hydrolase